MKIIFTRPVQSAALEIRPGKLHLHVHTGNQVTPGPMPHFRAEAL